MLLGLEDGLAVAFVVTDKTHQQGQHRARQRRRLIGNARWSKYSQRAKQGTIALVPHINLEIVSHGGAPRASAELDRPGVKLLLLLVFEKEKRAVRLRLRDNHAGRSCTSVCLSSFSFSSPISLLIDQSTVSKIGHLLPFKSVGYPSPSTIYSFHPS